MPMIAAKSEPLAQLYEKDETAWLEAMARLIKQRRRRELDFVHLAEYLTDMARRDRREVKSRLATLLAHLLKWRHQPKKRSRSLLVTAEQERQALVELLGSRTLRNHAEAILADAYADGLRLAIVETGLPTNEFPAECPFTLESLLQELPEEQESRQSLPSAKR
jgi:uncharacterized protein DUF29